MKLRDKYGWPVVSIKGRLITNLIRRLIHTSIQQTWSKSRRKYAVKFSAHGAIPQPETFSDFPFTWDEAESIAEEWEIRADTVGGYAEIVEK